MRHTLIILSLLLFGGCQKHEPQEEHIEPEFPEYILPWSSIEDIKNDSLRRYCFDGNANYWISAYSERKEMERRKKIPAMSVAEEKKLGQQSKASILESYRLVKGKRLKKLKRILNNLVPYTERHTIIPYTIYLIESKSAPVINAFITPGNMIYFTVGLYEAFGGDDDYLASIAGHEIFHAEGGDFTESMRRLKWYRQKLGAFGNVAHRLTRKVAPALDLHNETRADIGGLYLAHSGGYDIQRGVQVYRILGENDDNLYWFLSQSHPQGLTRYSCLTTLLFEFREEAKEAKDTYYKNLKK